MSPQANQMLDTHLRDQTNGNVWEAKGTKGLSTECTAGQKTGHEAARSAFEPDRIHFPLAELRRRLAARKLRAAAVHEAGHAGPKSPERDPGYVPSSRGMIVANPMSAPADAERKIATACPASCVAVRCISSGVSGAVVLGPRGLLVSSATRSPWDSAWPALRARRLAPRTMRSTSAPVSPTESWPRVLVLLAVLGVIGERGADYRVHERLGQSPQRGIAVSART